MDEDHGYRQWLWLPKMSLDGLCHWWTALGSIEPYSIEPDGVVRKKYPPHLLDKIKRLPGKLFLVRDGQTDREFHELWQGGIHPRALLNLDHDSHLELPDGRCIYHAGYKAPSEWDDSELAVLEELRQRTLSGDPGD